MAQKPMLMLSGITKTVYLVTSYKELEDGNYLANKKIDFDEEFYKIARMKGLI